MIQSKDEEDEKKLNVEEKDNDKIKETVDSIEVEIGEQSEESSNKTTSRRQKDANGYQRIPKDARKLAVLYKEISKRPDEESQKPKICSG